MKFYSFPLYVSLLLLPVLAFSAGVGTYIEDLNPVVYLELNQTPTASVTLTDGTLLTKSSSFAGDFPSLVSGPNAWVEDAWDFSVCDGPYLLDVDAAMSAVGDISTTDGMAVSFWTKGSYSGVISRIMAGSFDIGTKPQGVYAGTRDFKNAATPNSLNTWDDNWHHITVSIDFTVLEDTIVLYQDGVRVGTKDAAYLNSVSTSIGSDWYFGARNAVDTGFDFGELAGISVFARSLSEYEVNAIYAGPVFAGLDQTVSIVETITLDGRVANGGSPVWSMVSGPASVTFGDANSEDTSVNITATGDYIFQLSAGGVSSTVAITVVPNATPTVIAGNGIVLPSSGMSTNLDATVEDSSIPAGGALLSTWSVLSAPVGGVVVFGDVNDPKSSVSFNLPGLYRLQLHATDGVLEATDPISVLIDDSDVDSYVRLLQPVAFFSFDRPAISQDGAQVDFTGSTGYLVRYAENGLPQLDTGARSYTGYSWDFAMTDSDLELINGEHLAFVNQKAHPARSISYWYRADGTADEGYISNLFGLQSYRSGQLVTHEYSNQFTSLSASPSTSTWHHIVVVFDTSNGDVQRKLYVDGVLIDQATDAFPGVNWEWGVAEIRTPLYLASRGRSGEADNFGGQLDDWALFDYALSDEDVAYLYGGPDAAESALLATQLTLSVDAGANQYIQLPASYDLSLAGSAVSASGLTPSWQLIEGDGTVNFSNPASLSPVASFTTIEDDEDGAYSRFILELSLKDSSGLVLVSDQVEVVFYPDRAPTPRTLTATPDIGEHPRIFFTMADLPDLRAKATTVPLVIRALSAIQVDVAALDNPTSNFGAFYEKLKNGEAISVETVSGVNAEGGIFKVMAEAAYIALLGSGGASDTAKLDELAAVFTLAARDVATWYEPNYTNPLVHDVNWYIGLCYDLLYNQMDTAGRDDVRALISRMTSHRSPIGAHLQPRLNSTNWAGLHDHILAAALAIEGEEGYDVGVLDAVSRANSDFLTQYGVFESGFPHEGYAYYILGMTQHSLADHASSRRTGRENIYQTTRFYKSIETALRLLDPDGSGLRSHHDVVEEANSSGSGVVKQLPRHILIAKYMWPNDRMVDYVYSKLLANLLTDQDRYFDVFHAIFGESVAYPSQTVADAAGALEPNVFCPDRGFATSRNEWEEDGLRFEFRCRTDKYWLGHQHADVNSFELWSHGKEWILDRGKFASTNSDVASTIFIDDTGACSADNFRWPSLPGQFVEYAETDTETIAVGDARLFYTYSLGAPATNPENYKVTDHGLMWSDFYTPRAGYTMPSWMSTTPYDLSGYSSLLGIYRMLPVEFAYRTTLLTKGSHPFTLIVDDIQQDNSVHDYTWIANTPISGLVEVESQTADKLVLRYAGETTSGARLLVQVLEATGQTGSIYLDTNPIAFGVESIEASRIKIECSDVLKPNYKVLLYPYEVGDPLPIVQWNTNGNTVSISIGDEQRQFYFDTSVDERTRISSETPAVEVAESSVDLSAVVGYAPGSPTSHQFDLISNLDGAQNWSASSDQTWLTLSSTSGVLAANGTLNLTATLNAEVQSLPLGTYTANITFSSDEDIFDRVLTVTLSVVEPYVISPTSATIDVVIDAVESISRSFTIDSQLPVAQNWTASSDQSWLTLSSTSGAITSGGSLDLTASLGAAAFSLAEGSYQATIRFDSDARAVDSLIVVTVNVSEAPLFIPSENFTTFDLENKQLTFVPSGDSYRVYVDPVTEFPVAVAAGDELVGSAPVHSYTGRDDGYWTFTPAWEHFSSLAGVAIGANLHVGTNGLVSFDTPPSFRWTQTALSDHYDTLQISAFLDDLNAANNGKLYYKFTAGDRAVITFDGISQYGGSDNNQFQVEIFDDGSGIVRITYLNVDANDVVVGISSGQGAPVGDNVDFSEMSPYPVPNVLPELSLLLLDGVTSEWSNPLDAASVGILSDGLLDSTLSVNLSFGGSATAADITGTLTAGAHDFASGLDELNLAAQAIDDALAEGTESLEVRLQPGAGYTIGTPSMVAISLLDEPYDHWRFTNGVVLMASAEDLDGDGIPTLVEFALGSNPEARDRAYTMTADMVAKRVTIVLDHPVPTNVSLSAEWCEDLSNWRSDNVSIVDQTITINGFSGDKVFVRLVANLN